jgi:hypothetical protein
VAVDNLNRCALKVQLKNGKLFYQSFICNGNNGGDDEEEPTPPTP